MMITEALTLPRKSPARRNPGLSRPTLISKIEKHKFASRPPPSAKSSVTYLVLIGSGVKNRHPVGAACSRDWRSRLDL